MTLFYVNDIVTEPQRGPKVTTNLKTRRPHKFISESDVPAARYRRWHERIQSHGTPHLWRRSASALQIWTKKKSNKYLLCVCACVCDDDDESYVSTFGKK